MIHTWKIAALAACCTLLLGIAAVAQEESSVVVEPQVAPAEAPALPAPEQPAVVETMPAPVAADEAAAEVHPAPPIVSHVSLRARRLYRCEKMVEVKVVAKNPADCCLYEIPLCIPACCTGEPKVTEGCGLLGRGVVEFCWPCGFSATVKFRPVLCDVKIRYDG
jgi:hypothetical protein